MQYVNERSIEALRSTFPQCTIYAYCPTKSWQTSRYIQIRIKGYDEDIHYEYRIDGAWKGWVELHFEKEGEEKYASLIDLLIKHTEGRENLIWEEWSWGYRCRHSKEIDTIEDLCQTLTEMKSIFDPVLSESKDNSPKATARELPSDSSWTPSDNQVDLYEMRYAEVVRRHLTIPNYQRIYCWEERHVKCLLDDVFEHIASAGDTPYRLGTLILHAHDGHYDIIDGQQRLITLALLLSALGIKTSLLREKLTSKQSKAYVAYNKHLIQQYVDRRIPQASKRIEQAESLLQRIEWSVLILQNTSIDLAYTFFSHQNSRGVALSDYDLLKAHHLRYIPLGNESQAQHVTEVWNQMIEEGRKENQNTQPDYVRTLDTYIYRLRKWMRKAECDDRTGNYRIKRAYEAAALIDEIPPFGESFHFNEPIQGGAHFFGYVERHRHKYHAFCQTEEYSTLHTTMQGGSFQWYRDAIESVLFAYFLKFGTDYLSEALMLIMRIVLQHRYEHARAIKASIVRHVGASELVLGIAQATSPTFFLAEARDRVQELIYPNRKDMTPIMRSMRSKANSINQSLRSRIVVTSMKNIHL